MRKIWVIYISMSLLLSLLMVISNLSSAPGVDLIIGDDESVYIVSGYEDWENVTVLTTGKLIVPAGAVLNATNISLEGNSIIEITGGFINMINSNHAGDVTLNGTCSYFNITSGGMITMMGSNGYANTSTPSPYDAYIPVSMGGDAKLNITILNGLKIYDAMITIIGGDGFDLPSSTHLACRAWTYSKPLSGYVAAGGNATMVFQAENDASIDLYNSNLNLTGGEGGNAAKGGDTPMGIDLNPGKGGGYANGQGVSGYVGSGGNAIINISSDYWVNIDYTNISANGGNGGRGGDGGTDDYTGRGGGGGGYCGGNATEWGTFTASGFVGSGGYANITIITINISISHSEISTCGGNGGDGGDGGDFGHDSGGGGGGYVGGGGGSGHGGIPSGGNGIVEECVGMGGNALIFIYAIDIELEDSYLSTRGGYGGNGGNGGGCIDGNSDGSGGGGGYAGGGGSGGGNGGNGIVRGYVGSGGNACIIIISEYLRFMNSILFINGGNGGNGGDGGSVDFSGNGGAGGGGYGGGGGAVMSGSSNSAGNCEVQDYVGSGGNAYSKIIVENLILSLSEILNYGGEGGNGGIGGNGVNGEGGGGGGGYGGGGGTGAWPKNGGNTTVDGFVGAGGDSIINITSTELITTSSTIVSEAGNGGEGGVPGNGKSDVGGGGGGYGGGGGAGIYDNQGGTGNVGINVGRGGNSSISLYSLQSTISSNTEFYTSFGTGGSLDYPGGGGVKGGYGAGNGGSIGSNGTSVIYIPMSILLLTDPSNNTKIEDANPRFKWTAVHDSTTNGSIVNYVLEVDNNQDFSSPEITSIQNTTTYEPSPYLPEGSYYWRVKSIYASPPESSAGWSEVWNLSIYYVAPKPRLLTPVDNEHITNVLNLTATSDEDTVSVEFYYFDGNWHFIGNGEYDGVEDKWYCNWDTTALNLYNISISVNVTDMFDLWTNVSSSGFEIDNTSPNPILLSPQDNDHISMKYNLTATSDPDTVTLDFYYFDGEWHYISSGQYDSSSDIWYYNWSTHSLNIAEITISVNATDEAGLMGNSTNTDIEIDNNDPDIIILTPLRNELIRGIYNLTARSDPDTVLLDFTYEENETIQVIGKCSYDSTTDTWYYLWDTSNLNLQDVTIIVFAQDDAGVWGIEGIDGITIDNTAPSIVSLIPSDNSENVPVDTSITIEFSESIDIDNFTIDVSIDPSTDIVYYEWNADNTILIMVLPLNLAQDTKYTITADISAKDVAGNLFESSITWSFTTWLDTDDDGIPNNEDPDDDNDDVPDDEDYYPLDPDKWEEPFNLFPIIILITIIIISVLIGILLIKRRKKGKMLEEESTPGKETERKRENKLSPSEEINKPQKEKILPPPK